LVAYYDVKKLENNEKAERLLLQDKSFIVKGKSGELREWPVVGL